MRGRGVLIAGVVLCGLPRLAFGVGQITGLLLNNNTAPFGPSVNSSVDGSCWQQGKSSLNVVSSNALTINTRFAISAAGDCETTDPLPRSNGSDADLHGDYQLSFNVQGCPAGTNYTLTVAQRWKGSMTTNEDTGQACDAPFFGGNNSATASLTGLTGQQTGASACGGDPLCVAALTVAAPASLTSSGDSDQPFDQTANAVLTGTATGSPQAHTLRFFSRARCQGQSDDTDTAAECAVRAGFESDIDTCIQGDNVDRLEADDYNNGGGFPPVRTLNGDGHLVTVTLQCLCGNGVIDAGETCDDGDISGGDGCSGTCALESGWSCTGQPSLCVSICGDSLVVGAEQCDQGGLNGGTLACCNANCTFRSAGLVCRTAADQCDAVESCTGTSGSCPPDGPLTSGAACADDGNPCTSDQCNGSSIVCQHAAGNAGAQCRPEAGPCDIVEFCTGSSPSCPADLKFIAGSPCTSDGNPCTVDECDGSTTACQHPVGNAGAVCRASAGTCDPQETCSGSSPTCPADILTGAGAPCTSDSNPCTLDQCNGTNPACQHPPGNTGAVGRASAGTCDPQETCTGASAACPGDILTSAGVECRAASGTCDVAESCTGSSPNCPTDGVKANGTLCRTGSGDLCDPNENCDGTAKTCPTDVVQPGATTCRAAAAVCDLAEHCPGVAGQACPTDAKSTAVCRPATDVCDVAESCDGVANTCPANGVVGAGVECRAAVGVCDVAETCNGSSLSCGPDLFLPNGTTCSDGEACTSGDSCQAGACVPGIFTCESACDPAPRTGCTTSTRAQGSLLQIKRSTPASAGDKLKWKWNFGGATDLADLGNPETGTTTYTVCVYDGASLIYQGNVLSQGTCVGRPCWGGNAKGFKYRDIGGAEEGLTAMKLKSGVNGKAKFLIGAGNKTGTLGNGLNAAPPYTGPVVAQLLNSLNQCWEAEFEAPFPRNQDGRFKAKSVAP